ncbi:MBL fold metallo-hydrolase [Amycolatopsis sp. NPDC098790]|uniref:MBL fold metallo-hydrolase n=1 Tax=Amycolatopsis sp. NPDC098790 TaxID=3363939 RepID=UPI00382B1AB6
MSDPLEYHVLVHPGIPQHTDQTDPDGAPRIWSPISTTFIRSGEELVVVDPGLTFDHARAVADRVKDSGKRLVAVYATHGHGDHWFAAGPLLEEFPDAVVHATPGTIGVMRQNADPAFRGQRFDAIFPDQVPPSPVRARPIPAEGIELGGHRLLAVEVGHTDTDDTTVLHAPSTGLVVAGDAVYNNVHQYLSEIVDGGLEAWLAALDKIEALAPTAVVSGHKDARRPDSPDTIGETRQYLLDARRLLGEHSTARGFYDAMVRLHPGRVNRGALWRGALALLPE